MSQAFVPSHRLLLRGESILLMLDGDGVGDGPLYTRTEYEEFKGACWSLLGGRLLMRGMSIDGARLESLAGPTATTTSILHPPVSADWMHSPEYPELLWIRDDGKVGIRLCGGVARLYPDAARFCRSWKVMVTFHAPPGVDGLPEEVIVRYNGEWNALYASGMVRMFPSALSLCEYIARNRPRSAVPFPANPSQHLYHWPARVDQDHGSFAVTDGVETEGTLWDESLRQYRHHVESRTLGGSWPCHQRVHPQGIVPLRGPVNKEVLHAMAKVLTTHGWNQPPVVAEVRPHGVLAAWSARHALMAARVAGFCSIPVVHVDLAKWSDAHGAVGVGGALFETRDPAHRAQMLALSGDGYPCGLLVRDILVKDS